jgi:CRISPR-associated protein Cas1
MGALTYHLRRAGVYVASGYGLKIHVRHGRLVVEDGVGRNRRSRTFSRATHGISRLIVIGSDGYVTLDAVRWLNQLGISLIHLDRDGSILATTTPHGGDARLRRLQAAAASNETGIEVSRLLLQAKLDGQAAVLAALRPDAETEASFQAAVTALGRAESLDQLVWAERDAALAYWSAWTRLKVRFARRDEPVVPDNWLTVGKRGSVLTNAPRLATTPANAVLNYLYAILEAETRLACLKLGLDPGLGIVHVDYQSRDSFALDLMEAARPSVDAYVLELLQARVFRRRDFAETARGVCRINPPLSHELAETAPHWAAAIAPAAEAVAKLLATESHGSRVAKVATPLTGRNRLARYDREPRLPHAKTPQTNGACKDCGGLLPRRGRVYCDDCLPRAKTPQTNGACKDCGGLLPRRGRVYCDDCLPANTQHGRGLTATEWADRKGNDPTHGHTAGKARAASNITRKTQARDWDEKHGKLVDLSAFQRDILPKIQNIPLSQLQRATGLSLRYVSLIRRGERTPHPRHWESLLSTCSIGAVGVEG